MTPVVIKLGGSLLGRDVVFDWLDVIARNGAGRAVLVPGGGRHADAIRAAQVRQGLDDETAHRRAIGAMQQTAHDLIAMAPGFRLAASAEQIMAVLAAGDIPVAVPITDWLAADDIESSWDWSSDSLALWLARRLRADGMLLVKSVMPDRQVHGVVDAARDGIVDAAFPELLGIAGLPVDWAGPAQAGLFSRWLDEGEPVYCRLAGLSENAPA